ncbi:MAG TPA: phosphate ABC transporter substrate-binding protein PstS [Hyphomicrobiales bacterium]|nr:phosphate ABC transporter substrate-binding protein PstS [Hyphomicrobiales bacterium]
MWFPLLAIAADFSGAGATFPYPIYAKWAGRYKLETGKELTYQPIGSSAGIEAIKARRVTFGASDVPLTARALADNGKLTQWPMVIGGIVPIIHLDGIGPDQMVLDGDTLAKIFLGTVTFWDDPALQRLNPGLKLPFAPIVTVHRSGGSGTTFNFTNYLSKVNAEWKEKLGANAAVAWPAGIEAKGNQGVAEAVQQTKNSIGYVEAAFAKQNGLITTKMINRAGRTVTITSASVRAAAAHWWWAGLDWEEGNGLALNIIDQPGTAAWPIAAPSFILMPVEVTNAREAREALQFFAWAYARGDQEAEELNYVPIPQAIKQLVMHFWTTMKGPDGDAVYAAP